MGILVRWNGGSIPSGELEQDTHHALMDGPCVTAEYFAQHLEEFARVLRRMYPCDDTPKRVIKDSPQA